VIRGKEFGKFLKHLPSESLDHGVDVQINDANLLILNSERCHQDYASPVCLPVIRGTKRSRDSKSQYDPRKRVAKASPFGRPGPTGYWIPDEGVQKQKAPRGGSSGTEGSIGDHQLSGILISDCLTTGC